MSELLLEGFADELDEINDHLTDITETDVNGKQGVTDLVFQADNFLRTKGMQVNSDDVESFLEDFEEPTEFEGINILFPIYGIDESDTDYNLSLTYVSAETGYVAELEVQYNWEADAEVETDYIDYGDNSDFSVWKD